MVYYILCNSDPQTTLYAIPTVRTATVCFRLILFGSERRAGAQRGKQNKGAPNFVRQGYYNYLLVHMYIGRNSGRSPRWPKAFEYL